MFFLQACDGNHMLNYGINVVVFLQLIYFLYEKYYEQNSNISLIVVILFFPQPVIILYNINCYLSRFFI
jgi:hypothetical protein